MNPSRLFFARAVLTYGHFEQGPTYEDCLLAVMTGEGSEAHWNPLDTTLWAPGSTPYNNFGPANEYHVWNYETGLIGVHYTVATMNQSNMYEWTKWMRTPGQSLDNLCRAFAHCPWGGIGDLLPLEIAKDWETGSRDHVKDRQVLVAGNGGWFFDEHGNQTPTAMP